LIPDPRLLSHLQQTLLFLRRAKEGSARPERVRRSFTNWLKEVLAQHGFTKDDRMMTMYGGMDLNDREDVKNAFQSGPEEAQVRILLATDAAAEGLN